MRLRHRLGIAFFVLILAQIVASFTFYERLQVPVGRPDLTDSPVPWMERLEGSDAGAYLSVGKHFAETGALEGYCSQCKPPQWTPFTFWAPGAPFLIGLVFKAFPSDRMLAYFVVVALLEFIANALLLILISRFVFSLGALVVASLLLAYCPPLQHFYYSFYHLTSSEPLTLGLFGGAYLMLGYATRQLWSASATSPRTQLHFSATGIFIGLISLVRDSNSHFALFLAILIFMQALVRKRHALKLVCLALAVMLISVHLVRLPVKVWNSKRVGHSTVSTSGGYAIWYGMWANVSPETVSNPDIYSWMHTSGQGAANTIDPEAGKRVRNAFEAGRNGTRTSIIELLSLLVRHPVEFAQYKLERLPILFLGTGMAPDIKWNHVSIYTAFLYLVLAGYLLMCLLSRTWPSEVFYAYPLFIIACSVLIHFEFRYSFPALLAIKALPAVVIDDLYRKWSSRRLLGR